MDVSGLKEGGRTDRVAGHGEGVVILGGGVEHRA